MLRKIRFKNYKSFTRETVISLEKTKLAILDDSNTENGILKGCAFFGANASGKTNALNTISLLLDLLFANATADLSGVVTLFNNEKTAYFEYTFLFDEGEIVYFFEVDRKGRFVKETLDIGKERVLTRLLNSAESLITENRTYGKDDIDENTLFLRSIYFNTKFASYPLLKKWFDFLSKSIYINVGQRRVISYGQKVEELMLQTYLDNHGDREINEFLDAFDFPYVISYRKAGGEIDSSFENRLSFIRKELPPVVFRMESYGNQILLMLLPAVISQIKNNSMLIIDEFSSGLHNSLEELLIRYVYKRSSSQLFFVSHSTNLLKTSLIRPDQIYSVDFDGEGSFLKKFSDEHPRESQNLEKMYLSGVFGGIPIYDRSHLDP